MAGLNELHAWAAGFIDGEGTIGLYCPTGRVNRATRQPVLQVPQTHQAPLTMLAFTFGGRVTAAHVTKKGSQMYLWRAGDAANTAATLEKIMSYLVLKTPEAKIVHAYCQFVRARHESGKSRVYSLDEQRERQKLCDEFDKMREGVWTPGSRNRRAA